MNKFLMALMISVPLAGVVLMGAAIAHTLRAGERPSVTLLAFIYSGPTCQLTDQALISWPGEFGGVQLDEVVHARGLSAGELEPQQRQSARARANPWPRTKARARRSFTIGQKSGLGGEGPRHSAQW